MENKVVYEVRLSKPVMVIATVAVFSLLAISVKPLMQAKPAFAYGEVQKIAICNKHGSSCAPVSSVYGITVRN